MGIFKESLKRVHPFSWVGTSLAITFIFVFVQSNSKTDVGLLNPNISTATPVSNGWEDSDEYGGEVGGAEETEVPEQGFVEIILNILREGGQFIIVQLGDRGAIDTIRRWMEEMGVTGEQNLRDFLSNPDLVISLVVAKDGRVVRFEYLEDFNIYFRSVEAGGEGNYLFPGDVIVLELRNNFVPGVRFELTTSGL